VAIEVQVLGSFEVRRDGVRLPAFPLREAASLVKLLAPAPGHRLPSERVAGTLWPELRPDVARARLHKAAHFAHRALGEPDGVQVHGNWVSLLRGHRVEVDAERFEAAATPSASGGGRWPWPSGWTATTSAARRCSTSAANGWTTATSAAPPISTAPSRWPPRTPVSSSRCAPASKPRAARTAPAGSPTPTATWTSACASPNTASSSAVSSGCG
jgi:hypothetical protein